MAEPLQELRTRFALPGLSFDDHHGGLVRAVVKTAISEGAVFLQGAHVSHFQPAGQHPVLWMSEKSWFEAGRPIRGGVPICFPWFGPHPSDASAPGHGSVRLQPWRLTSAELLEDGGIGVRLQASCAPFDMTYRVQFGRSLVMEFSVELSEQAEVAAEYEEALHTYFSVGDIHRTTVSGLEQSDFVDTVGGRTERKASGQPIRFESETDQVYQNTIGACVIHDPALERRIVIDRRNSASTVVWNPWIAKSVRMPDFGDHEWPGMLCVETANIRENRVRLQPGQQHTLRTTIESLPSAG